MPVAPKELLANIPPFGLRMQPELKDRLKSAAEANNRSMNAEITTVLEDALMARGDFPSAKQDQFVLRFPDGMRGRIKEAAEASNRSMNAEIVTILEDCFMSREDPQLKLRMTDEMKARITEAARTNGRSVNAEILARLGATLDPPPAPDQRPQTFYGDINKIIEQTVRHVLRDERVSYDSSALSS